jgi:hypothetical protein
MAEAFYSTDRISIVNLSATDAADEAAFLESAGFRELAAQYFKYLAMSDIGTFRWLTRGRQLEEMVPDTAQLARQLLTQDVREIYSPAFDEANRIRALYLTEDLYNFWRSRQRIGLVQQADRPLTQADEAYQKLVQKIYHTAKWKLQGEQPLVLRQLSPELQVLARIKTCRWAMPQAMPTMKGIPFVTQLLLKTPLYFSPAPAGPVYPLRPAAQDPLRSVMDGKREWFCYPLKTAGCVGFVYFHRDWFAPACALADLFPLADEAQCRRRPDFLILYGLKGQPAGFYLHQDHNLPIGWAGEEAALADPRLLKSLVDQMLDRCLDPVQAQPVSGTLAEFYFADESCRRLWVAGQDQEAVSAFLGALKQTALSADGPKRLAAIHVVFHGRGYLDSDEPRVAGWGAAVGAIGRCGELRGTLSFVDRERGIFYGPTDQDTAVLPIGSLQDVTTRYPLDLAVALDGRTRTLHRFRKASRAMNAFLAPDQQREGSQAIFARMLKDRVWLAGGAGSPEDAAAVYAAMIGGKQK